MDVPITHIIGTAALIGLVISVALAYTIIVDYVEANVLKPQLKQIAEYVSMNIVNLISLTEFAYGESPSSTVVTKTLKIPRNLNEKAYLVRLVNEGGNCYVEVKLVARGDIYATSPIPLNSTRARVTIAATEEKINEVISGGFPDNTITLTTTVYSGNLNILIWCWKNGTIYAGLGIRVGGV
jgi:hypothetical protein